VTDRDDQERPQGTPAEGVRILGAEEARAAVQQQQGQTSAPDDDRDEPAERDPDDGPTWSATDGRDDAETGSEGNAEPPSGEVPPLPHWTEPPTGAVPAIFADDEGDGDDLEVWASITGSQPRFRAEGSDWANPDFVDNLADEDEERLGALSEEGPVDEEAEFAEALAVRRRRTPRGRPARTLTTASAARQPEEPEPDHPQPSTRDLPTALVTAAGIVVVALLCFHWGRTWTAVLAAIIVGFASLEFANTLRLRGFRPATLPAFVACLTLPLAAKHYGVGAYPVFFALVVVFSMLWFLWNVTPGRPLLGVATTVLTFAYIGGLGGFAGLLLTKRNGVGLVIGVALCVVAYDVGGYFVGSWFGRTPIAPHISPNKTREGTMGGMLASLVVGALLVGLIGPWTHKSGLALGALVAVGAFLGDLCESMIKRDLGVKDFGSILPGHGGALDRFDGMLFCLPIAYYLALHLKIA
jgi:phosphatidate cytidylyltransferase